MPFNVGEKVWKQYKDMMLTGVFLGQFRDLEGKLHLVFQNSDSRQIFFSDPSHLHRIAEAKEAFVRY